MVDADFWHERWRDGRIGFHRAEVNPWLREYFPGLGVAAGGRVLIPLCGKSLDLGWLADQGFRPVGVELSPIACAALFEERGVKPERDSLGALECWRGGGIEVYCGDFLAPELVDIEPCSGLWDRASLIALPQAMRPDYVQQCTRLLTPAAAGLLVSLEYDPGEMDGPPFSVSPAEIERLYRSAFDLRPRVLQQYAEPSPHLVERGLSALHESVWILHRREEGENE